MPHDAVADQVWRDLVALVVEHRDGWKRAVIARSGLPFSRIRILKRLSRAPMTVKELAVAATIDAPAATVAVNALEERGLVVRQVDPRNRRCKQVSLTDAGHAVVHAIDEVYDPAPDVFSALDADDLAALQRILQKLTGR
ncbi:MarR family winged helix-turn-helix transcriptional regulator [Mycobacterium sp. SMC-4]|uniref:MarR family winged helix-turn-helix transcriptional regulator n=1 Tax=Mycobacterium sp. SMC-4 TaxID=2857059 RepID=UPI003CFE565C